MCNKFLSVNFFYIDLDMEGLFIPARATMKVKLSERVHGFLQSRDMVNLLKIIDLSMRAFLTMMNLLDEIKVFN